MAVKHQTTTKRAATPLGMSGAVEARYRQSADLVTLEEARSRLGWGADVDVVAKLRRRKSVLFAGDNGAWLIDLTALAKGAASSVDELPAAAFVIESGDRM